MSKFWYKNIIAFRIGSEANPSQSNWEELIAKKAHQPIMPSVEHSIGFTRVLGEYGSELFTHEFGGYLYIALMIESKKIKSRQVKKITRERVAEQENKTGEKLDKGSVAAIQDAVKFELLKQTFPDEEVIQGCIDTDEGFVFVNASSQKKAETFMEHLRDAIGELSYKPYFDSSLSVFLTNWLNDPSEMPPQLQPLDECTLKDAENAKATLSKQDLGSEEVTLLINHGKQVTDIYLEWQEEVSFKITAEGYIKKFKPTDMLISEVDGEMSDDGDMVQVCEANWMIMSRTLSKLFAWLLEVMPVNTDQ